MPKELVRSSNVSVDDTLGWTIISSGLPRSYDLWPCGIVQLGYPNLSTLVGSEDASARTGAGLARVRRHAVDLARMSIVNENIRISLRSFNWTSNSARCDVNNFRQS